MAKLFDANGKEVEAFTSEELEAKNKEALEEYKKANPDKTGELTQAQKDLETANNKIKELETAGGSDEQKKRLKQEKEDAEKKLGEVTDKLTKDMAALKDSIFGSQKTKILDKLSNGDVELRKKIELEYDGFKGEASNEVEIQTRLVKAATIVTGNKPAPNFMDGMSNAGPKGTHDGAGKPVETEEAKAQRKALGISDQDAEKFAPKPAN